MDKQIVFLSGLPRTGSTLLTSILSQNPDIYVDGSSPLARVMFGAHYVCENYAKDPLVRVRREDFLHELLTAIPEIYYKNVQQTIICEKDRAWTHDPLGFIRYLSDKPRIVVMLRPIPEIVKSFVFVKRQNKDLLPERYLLQRGVDPLMEAIDNTAFALSHVSEKYLFGTYEQLVSNPQSFLDQVCDFWNIPKRQWDFANITNPKPENDSAFDNEGLHDIRPTIGKREYETIVSFRVRNFAKKLDEALWHDYEQAKQLRPESFIA